MAERDGRKGPPVTDLASFLGHGLRWAASTALFLFLGWLLDDWLSTTPLFTILGAFIGAGAGFYSLYHHLVVKGREDDSAEDSEDE